MADRKNESGPGPGWQNKPTKNPAGKPTYSNPVIGAAATISAESGVGGSNGRRNLAESRLKAEVPDMTDYGRQQVVDNVRRGVGVPDRIPEMEREIPKANLQYKRLVKPLPRRNEGQEDRSPDGTIPTFKRGGTMKKSGRALLHKGERAAKSRGGCR